MKVLQANLNRSRLADDLLEQLVTELKVDLVIISEQYKNKNTARWYSDTLGTAAIWIPKLNSIVVENGGSDAGFVHLKCNMVTIFSCYFTPNESIDQFQQKLDILEDTILRTEGAVIVAGDFNARAVEWGMPSINSRGNKILEMAARLGLNVMNEGDTRTFRRPGYNGSIPDITLASECVVPKLTNWRVIEDFTGSDHQYIVYDVLNDHRITGSKQKAKWNATKMDKGKLQAIIERGKDRAVRNENADSTVRATMELIHKACKASMPLKKTLHGNKKPAYWWTDEVAEQRKWCLKCRRKATRTRRRGETEAAAAAQLYKQAKKGLRKIILKSKRASWEMLRSEIELDPWGLGYKVVMKKLGKLAPSPLMNAEETQHIVDTLFPTHPDREERKYVVENSEIPMFTEEELLKAVSAMKSGKAPGPDGVPTEALKVTARSCPSILLNMYNKSLEEGMFHKQWKEQRLVLVSKGKGDPRSPSAYRPLCMLNTAGKLLERLLKPRLVTAIREGGDLSNKQYGFRCGRSTIDAIQEVGKIARVAQTGNHFSRKIVLLVTLDVKNAFNSARWPDIMQALEITFKVPKYLLRIIDSYLSNRILLFDTTEGQHKKKVTAGATQGSVLGPDLWNAMYDGLLKMEMPENASLIGFADDVAAVIVAKDTESAQRKLGHVMREVTEWMEQYGLSIATEKTEIVMITKKHIPTLVPMRIGMESIETKSHVKYLGMRIDTKLTYWCQIQHAADKAAKVTTALSRLMGNIRGPGQNKRRLLMSVTHSIMLYGCEVWADALRIEKYRKRMAAVQRRGALRVTCSYRTVSEPAVLVIAGIVPIDLMALERRDMYNVKETAGKKELKQLLKARTMQRWQERWNEDSRGRWTARLIRDLRGWTERKFGEVNFFLTQFLSGHGYFAEYLYRMGKRPSKNCIYCDADKDDAFHTFFECQMWAPIRRQLESSIGELKADDIIEKMVSNIYCWEKVATYVEDVLRRKKPELDANT